MILPCPPLDRSEALRYLGVRGKAPDDITALLERAEALLCEKVKPRYVWRAVDPPDFPGEDLARHLAGCRTAVLFAVTLGQESEELFRRAQSGDMALAVTLDAAASALTESCCDLAETEIQKAFPDRYFTFRFSPGYGDLPLSVQRDMIRLLNAERLIGLTVSPSDMLLPQKSVTAILGVSDAELPKARRGCALCRMREQCQYRKAGEHCGF